MAQKVGYKRRLYLIDKDFQFGYLLTWLFMMLMLVGGMVLATLTMFFYFRGSLFPYAVEINSGLAVVFTGLSLYYMVKHSHRIAGPAYRLEYVIRQLARGEYDLNRKVYLRRKDYLKHVAEALNELIETRACEQDHMRVLMAGMSELDSAVQGTSGLSTEVKELSRMMFAEVVDLAQEQGVTGETETGTNGLNRSGAASTMRSQEVGACHCIRPLEAGTGTLTDETELDEEEAAVVSKGTCVNDYRRACSR